MFKKVLLFCLVCCFNLNIALATEDNIGLSQKDTEDLKRAARVLGNAFDVNVQQEGAGAQSTPSAQEEGKEESHKTVGDAMDKGLNMVKGFVVTLSSTLEKIAPRVWTVMVRQQYAKGIGLIVVPWGLLITLLIYISILKRLWRAPASKEELEDSMVSLDPEILDFVPRRWFVIYLPFVLGFFFTVWGVVNLRDAVLYFINPEYYAIKDLLEMILR